MSTLDLTFQLNGRAVNLKLSPDTLLVDLLRDILGLKGHQDRLPGRGMRSLHGPAGRRTGEFLHPAGPESPRPVRNDY